MGLGAVDAEQDLFNTKSLSNSWISLSSFALIFLLALGKIVGWNT